MNNTVQANKLIGEKSPYLLQHAYNPVEWYPWGAAAFEKAKAEDKPIFLSIGYSTCHWCHVMTHESFEDREVAEPLNRDFVSIKVDREERPDIDTVYMSVCQAMTGSGGWPLTVIMTAEQKPFFAGTYLPKKASFGRMGLLELLEEVKRLWKTNRLRLESAGEEIVSIIREQNTSAGAKAPLLREILNKAAMQFEKNYDPEWGGFGAAPKFPAPHNLLFLMRYSEAERLPKPLEMAEKTLVQMYRGGIFDHIGGGFSRYSTDEKWLVPHFEKMLYDNALLSYIYTEAYVCTRRELYKNAAVLTFDYVMRELANDHGAFFCGQDADSDGVEGKYYVFTPEEVKGVLGKLDGEKFCRYYGITEKGNFEKKSIPNLIYNPDFEEKNEKMRSLCVELYKYRSERTRLHKDDKILTSWNSLMIAAFAKAGFALDEPKYLEAAEKAQKFIAKNLVDSNGRLLVRWKEGEAAIAGHLDDYAFYIFALLELYGSVFEAYYLKEAILFARQMINSFFDREEGGFYFYGSEAEKLIARPKEVYDGAMPSGNSVAALCLARLADLTGDIELGEIAEKQLNFIASAVCAYPSAYGFSMIALLESAYPSAELICCTSENKAPDELKKYLQEERQNRLNIILKTPSNRESLTQIASYTGEYPIPDNGSVYYLCKNRACLKPVKSMEEIKENLNTAGNK